MPRVRVRIPCHQCACSFLLLRCAQGATLLTTLIAAQACGAQAAVRPNEQETQARHRPPSHALSLKSSGQPVCQFMQSPETPGKDNPPTIGHGSSRFEVGDRRTRGFRALHNWECITVSGEALRA